MQASALSGAVQLAEGRNPSFKRRQDVVVEPDPDDQEAQRRRSAGTQPGLRGFLARLPAWKLLFVLALWAAYLATELWKARNERCSAGYFIAYGTQARLPSAHPLERGPMPERGG